MHPLILDCDTGEDDALAILLAVKHSRRLRAVVSCFGNSSVANTARNSADVLFYAGATKIPVIQGSAGPLQPHLHRARNVDAVEFVGENGLCNMSLPKGTKVKIHKPGKKLPELLLKQLKSQGRVDYVVTGPCTNLARLIMHVGDQTHKYISRVFIMGGALKVPGNTGPINPKTNKPFAEFNFYCDPYAADVVLSSGLPIYLVSWDTTSKLTIPFDRYRKLRALDATGTFTLKLMSHFYSSFGLSLGRNFELNDPITVLAAMGTGDFIPKKAQIVTDGLQFGRSILAPRGQKVMLMDLKKDKVEGLLRSTLSMLGLSEPKVLD